VPELAIERTAPGKPAATAHDERQEREEENTRASAQFLDKIRMRLESSGQGIEPLLRT
jgi:hypothetical protein